MTNRLRRGRIRDLVRNFKENGMKLMLEHPANVRDLLNLLHPPWLDEIDFSRLAQIKTTFIRRDYRHLQSDIVLTAPLADVSGSPRKLLIYILIEHQSEPDRLMPLRLADSQLQIFRYQVRKWPRTHGSLARLRLFPVLPVVFYTGLRRWSHVRTLADLMVRGDEFRSLTPIVERPLFLNLPALPPADLARDGGFFGWVLWLVQHRRSRAAEFEQLLEDVVSHLQAMSPAERHRWRDLLSYIHAMIYHERDESEQAHLHEAVERSVQNEELRREVLVMGKTMAEVLIERGRSEGRSEGRLEGRTEGRTEGRSEAAIETRQQTLIRQLRRRFGEVPSNVVDAVASTTNVEQLDEWLDRLVVVSSLQEMGILR